MKFIKRLTAALTALTVSAVMLTSIPAYAEDKKDITFVKTGIGEIYRKGYYFGGFGMSEGLIDELYWAHPIDNDSVTFGEAYFYRLTDEALETFRKTGKLVFKKVRVDKSLKNVIAVPVYENCFFDKDGKGYTIYFDTEKNLLTKKDEFDKDEVFVSEYYDTAYGEINLKAKYKQGEKEHKNYLEMYYDGEKKCEKTLNFDSYFVNHYGYIFAAAYRNDYIDIVSIDPSNDFKVNKLMRIRDYDEVSLLNCRDSYEYLFYLALNRDENGNVTEQFLMKRDYDTKETSVVTKLDPSINIFNDFVCLIDSDGNNSYLFTLCDSEFRADRLLKYDSVKDECTEIELPEKIAPVSFDKAPYDDYYYIRDKNGKTITMNCVTGEFAVYTDFILYDTSTGLTVIQNEDGVFTIRTADGKTLESDTYSGDIGMLYDGEYAYIEGAGAKYFNGCIPVCKDGKGWFVDTELNRVSRYLKTDYIAAVGRGLYMYACDDKYYFLTMTEDYDYYQMDDIKQVFVHEVTDTEIVLKWNYLRKADFYILKYREEGGEWKYGYVLDNYAVLLDLKPDTKYEIYVKGAVLSDDQESFTDFDGVTALSVTTKNQ